jgi:transcriptional regulator with XRE-family HTH domain
MPLAVVEAVQTVQSLDGSGVPGGYAVSEMTSEDERDEQQRRHQAAEVVLYWMRRRGLTRQVFADRLGKSVSWVDKIKNGDRQLDRLSVLRQIARVLDIPLQVLVDPEEAERRRLCPDDRDIDAIRSALRRYDVITNVFRPNGDVLPEPNLAQLERSVRYGWMAFQVSDCQAIGQLLPELIRAAQAAVWQLGDDDQRAAKGWLSWTYQLTAATAFKLGDAQLGWIAADRGIQFAEQTEDLTLIGSAARWAAHALTDTFRTNDAVTMVRSAADRLSPHLQQADTAFMSAYGMLLLKGSIAAAQVYRAADVRDLQAEALNVALRLGTDRDVVHWSSFGATNVRVHEVSALADMQSGGRVIEAAARISEEDLTSLPKERRASHLVDVTRGYVQAGRREEAVATLLGADQFAPGEVRCRQTTRRLVEDLVRSYPRGSKPPAALATVARAVGVTV